MCPTSFNGPHCEYSTGGVSSTTNGSTHTTAATTNATSNSSGCRLDCKNGGTCVQGQRNASDLANEYHYWTDTTTTATMYCQCPDGWDGPDCSIARVPCGTNHCFHGATCRNATGNGETIYLCDCSAASTATASYAGRFCQYQATTYCTKASASSAAGTLPLFCVNQGTCRNNAYEGCNCPVGYTGFSCEFRTAASGTDVQYGKSVVDPVNATECTLNCLNGGTCSKGPSNATVAWPSHSHSTTSSNVSLDLQHCVCPDNYSGAACEHPSATPTCGEGQHLCLNGIKCVNAGDEQLCDCDQTNSSSLLATFYAGNRCAHPINDICTKETAGLSSSTVTFGNAIPGTVLSFCVNGGTCKRLVSSMEP